MMIIMILFKSVFRGLLCVLAFNNYSRVNLKCNEDLTLSLNEIKTPPNSVLKARLLMFLIIP